MGVCVSGPSAYGRSALVGERVFVSSSGAFDGYIRAYSSKDGAMLWQFDTGLPFNTVNGITASGGNVDGGGTTIADGRVFVNSGYGSWSGGSERLLLVFTVGGK